MNIDPLGNRVFCKRLEDTTKIGNVLVPDSIGARQTYTAEVLSVGPGARDLNGVLWPPTLQVGDKVIFWKGAGTNVGLDSERLTVITEDDVLGKVGELPE